MKPLVTKFSEAVQYSHAAGPNCDFFTLMPQGEIGDLNVGYVKMKGPTWTEVDRHTKWHQVYVIYKGKGRILIGEEEFPVEAPSLIRIPFDTKHAVRAEEGEEIEFIYINQHLKGD